MAAARVNLQIGLGGAAFFRFDGISLQMK